AERRSALGHLVGDEALHAGLEDSGAERQEHRAHEEELVDEILIGSAGRAQVGVEEAGDRERVTHQEIAGDLDRGGERDGELVAVAIGQATSEDGNEALDERPEGEKVALLLVSEL